MDPLEQARARFMEALGHHNAGRLGDAERLYRAALSHAPDRVSILANLAVVLASQDRLADARPFAERALALDPGQADAQVVIAACLRDARQPAEALALLEAVAAGRPDDPGARSNLALVLADLGRLERRADSPARAPDPDPVPRVPPAPVAAAAPDRLLAAFDVLRPALRASPVDAATRATFVALVAAHGLRAPGDADFRAHLATALATPWCRPQQLAPAAVATLRADPAVERLVGAALQAWPSRVPLAAAERALLDDPLLLALLEAVPAADAGLERLLCALRHAWLSEARDAASARHGAVPGAIGQPEGDLALRCALARQCQLVDYMYPLADAEFGDATVLRRACEQALDAGRPLPAAWVAVLACYMPLARIDRPGRLVDRLWRAPVEALLRQQVVEPATDHDATAAIERITAIDDPLSQRIAAGRGGRPSPHWTATAVPGEPERLDAYLRRRFPGAPYRVPAPRTPQTALYAGCGTGQGAVDAALRFEDMRVLAIDLDGAQLAYATRKARDAGLAQVRCAQGDVLRLMPSRERFDLVVADGVLQQMDDAAAGLSRLVAVLADAGAMCLTLCSERGRAPVRLARAHIAGRGYADSAEGVRAAREALLAMPGPWAAAVVALPAFHAGGSCRDLLFPVHESCLSPAAAAGLLADAGLVVIGVEADPGQQQLFDARFGGRGDRCDLAAWDALEAAHPDLFAGGYRVWAQRRPVRAAG